MTSNKNQNFDKNLQALKAINVMANTPHSLYLYASPGTGGGNIVKWIVQILQDAGKNVALVAVNDLLAGEVDGDVIEKAFNLSGKGITSVREAQLQKIRFSREDVSFINDLDIIVIFGINYVSGQLLDIMDYLLKDVRKCDLPFGGLQVLAVGDHFLTKPQRLITYGDLTKMGTDFLSSQAFNELQSLSLYLTLQEQCEDIEPAHFEIIQEVRKKERTSTSLEELNRRAVENKTRNYNKVTLATHEYGMITRNRSQLKEILKRKFGDDDKRIESELAIFEKRQHILEGTANTLANPVYAHAPVILIQDDLLGEYKKGDVGFVVSRGLLGCDVKLNSGAVISFQPKPRQNKDHSRIRKNWSHLKMCWATSTDLCKGLRLSGIDFILSDEKDRIGEVHFALAHSKGIDTLTFSRPLTEEDALIPSSIREFDEMVNSEDEALVLNMILGSIDKEQIEAD